MKFLIFVVDDDRHYSRLVSYQLDKNPELDVKVFHSGEEVLAALDDRPHLILLDIMMPGIDGIETLRRIKKHAGDIPVVMISAQGTIDIAIEAMKNGAEDYITKGQEDFIRLNRIVQNVTEKAALVEEVQNLRGEVARRYGLNEIIGDSPAMEQVYRLIQKTLRGDLTVAVQGESGTGKELVARAIHYNSNRKRGPFVVVNCAAIPHELMESEFFGHEKGSFTGAHARKIGKFEQADKGTIFLDEIGELDLSLQAKLLRALQNREIQRVGGNDIIEFDARVISATNQDIVTMIRDGKFREDLYYRLFQFPIQLPPLRERGQDVLLLSQYFVKEFKANHPDFKKKKLAPETNLAILKYAWPGNVRELKNAIERALLISDDDEVLPEDLLILDVPVIAPWEERTTDMAAEEERKQSEIIPESVSDIIERPETKQSVPDFELEESSMTEMVFGNGVDGIVSLDELKRKAVERAYYLCDGNVDKAAIELGIGRATMYRLLKKYDIVE